MKVQLLLATLALTFASIVHADTDHTEMDHTKMDHSQMTPEMMNTTHKSMDQEMIKIINTVDIKQRKKLFVAHKAKMKSMEGMMQGNCGMTKKK